MINNKIPLFLSMLIVLSACAPLEEKQESSRNVFETNSKEMALPTSHPKLRVLNLDGDELEEVIPGQFVTWKCGSYASSEKTIVEVGTGLIPIDFIKSPEYEESDDKTKKIYDVLAKDVGFVLYDGTNTGQITIYSRRGLNHRWTWGDENTFVFIIKPDGTGLFYDFTGVAEGESIKANDAYRCRM